MHKFADYITITKIDSVKTKQDSDNTNGIPMRISKTMFSNPVETQQDSIPVKRYEIQQQMSSRNKLLKLWNTTYY